jgi:hypothetical protein
LPIFLQGRHALLENNADKDLITAQWEAWKGNNQARVEPKRGDVSQPRVSASQGACSRSWDDKR